MNKETRQLVFAISLKGEVEVNGKVIKHLEGGFGENCRIILAKDIVEEHEVELKHINELINKNIKRFTNDDLLDLKVVADNDYNLDITNFGFSKMQLHKQVIFMFYQKEDIQNFLKY